MTSQQDKEKEKNMEATTVVVQGTDALAVVNDESTKTSTKRSSANASTQMQLLTLAKRFSLDGSLVSTDKQAPIEERARKRERISHLRQQHNLENIIQKAISYCSDDNVADKADQDWFSCFIEQAENISNATMQDLWARILAKEVSTPGAFSLKALKTFRTLSIHDAKLLAKVVSFTIRDSNRKNVRIISGSLQQPGLFNFFSKNRIVRVNLNNHGLTYTDLLNLADNHLLFIQEAESTILKRNETLTFNYNGQPFSLSTKKANCVLSFYKFTPVGTEIINLIGDKPDTDFFNAMKTALSPHFSFED